MDRIFIEELVVFAQIGVYDWEQQIKQKLVFDLEMAWDCQKAAVHFVYDDVIVELYCGGTMFS